MCNMTKWSELQWNHFILSFITFTQLYNCNLVFILKLAWMFNFQPLYDVFSVHLQFQNNKWNRFANKEKSPISDSKPHQLLASDYQPNVMYLWE